MAENSILITDTSQLVDWVAAGAKPKSAWRIGTVHEKILFHRGGFSPVGDGGRAGDKARRIME